ncbi:Uncharacterised protein [Arcanobacterium haemolyticum]|uniref:Uncharacterized protein n=1 Tax=Arcanobacterium haemolyticum (strain ATCC 9345 / DSM 20595 / CCM 5947 / CCUG 17215 / LMG 16163 / NBRC 15585 / NCTC 8452 / 11018) TaxID=644284 RepID=D7BL42_ARCHD|nr:hypothetical protein Arch_1689 [Arcanobacterium haemolyticum DSM 20595]SQH27738.1 Uncharacterised protein [Arcanobacterium haemolyticum]
MITDARIRILGTSTRADLDASLGHLAPMSSEGLDEGSRYLRRSGLPIEPTLIFDHPHLLLVCQEDDELFIKALTSGKLLHSDPEVEIEVDGRTNVVATRTKTTISQTVKSRPQTRTELVLRIIQNQKAHNQTHLLCQQRNRQPRIELSPKTESSQS